MGYKQMQLPPHYTHLTTSFLGQPRPVWARGRCRISPPRFLAECCKRQLNQVSFVLLYFRLSTFSDLYWVCLTVFSCTVLFVSISQVIGCEDRLRNDLYCVEWGVKLYSNSTLGWAVGETERSCRRIDVVEVMCLGPACCLCGAAIVDNAVFDVICWWPVLANSTVLLLLLLVWLTGYMYVHEFSVLSATLWVKKEGTCPILMLAS